MKLSASLTSIAFSIAAFFPNHSNAYPIDCAIFLCLAGGWPSSPDCNVARAEFVRRITPLPVEPPLQLWRCPMGATAGSANLSPMQRLEAIKAASGNTLPELPIDSQNTPQVVDVSYSAESWTALSGTEATVWKPLGAKDPWRVDPPALPAPTRASVDFSSSDFDVVRSIRVLHVAHFSRAFRPRSDGGGECETSYNIHLGTYDQQGNFHWSDTGPGAVPPWMNMRTTCEPASYFRGVGVEWRDVFGMHGYEVVEY